MTRPYNLRQIDAFRSVIENGTVSAAASVLHISQPAVSKLLALFEAQTGLALFERVKGRLVPTAQAMRLYAELDRIFAGMHQLDRAVELIKREHRGQLIVGVLPALSGEFIRTVVMHFLKQHPGVFVSVKVRASAVLLEWLASRQIDIALLNDQVNHPDLVLQPFMRKPLVALLPPGHALVAKPEITLQDLKDQPFVAFDTSVHIRRQVDRLFQEAGQLPRYVLEVTTAPALCEFVAAGLGVSLVHPSMAGTAVGRVVQRPFYPFVENHFLLGQTSQAHNARLLEDFVQAVHQAADPQDA